MEYSQTQKFRSLGASVDCLNPYSNGILTDMLRYRHDGQIIWS